MNYFVEGLQGSGKSTLVRALSERFRDHTALREGDYSPVELAWCAYLDEDAYRDVLEQYPGLRPQIEENTVAEGGRRVVCYTKVKTDDPAFYRELEQYEIYNGRMPDEEFRRTVLRRFAAWDGDGMIFECSLFQNIVEDMILFRQASDEEILAFYRQVRDALAGKRLHIVYLETADIPGSIGVVRRERVDDRGNEAWFSMLCGFFDASPWAAARGLRGEAALMAHLAHRQALELRLCREVFPGFVTVLRSKGYTDAELDTLPV